MERKFIANEKDAAALDSWYGDQSAWKAEGGAWQGSGEGRFLIRRERCGNCLFHADITLADEKACAALVSRSHSKADDCGYMARLGGDGTLELVRLPSILLGEVKVAPVAGAAHSLGIKTEDTIITVFLDGVAVLQAKDRGYPAGYFAVGVIRGKAAFSGIEAEEEGYTAQQVAMSITSAPVIDPKDKKLKMPMVPAGFIVRVNNSDHPEIIDADGYVYIGNQKTQVSLVFSVLSRYNDSIAYSSAVTVEVPAAAEEKTVPMDAVIDCICSVNAEKDDVAAAARKLCDAADMISLANFENPDEAEKTVSIVRNFSKRAVDTVLHTLPFERYVFNPDKPDARFYLSMAKNILGSVVTGDKLPFEGYFKDEYGGATDHAFIKKDGVYHLIYTRTTAVYQWCEESTWYFGHAISTDLIHWKVLQPALYTSVDGCDCFQVWAPYIFAYGGRYVMVYTGVNENTAQSICFAYSDDLYHWEKEKKNPVVIPGEKSRWSVAKWSDCRDPFIFMDDDKAYLYYTGTFFENGRDHCCICVASAQPDNLMVWKHENYIILPQGTNTPPESSYVTKQNGIYYLFYTDYQRGTAFVMSDNPVDGWYEFDDIRATAKPCERDDRFMPEQWETSGFETKAGCITASELLYDQDEDCWYFTGNVHLPYELHFLEFKKLIWNPDGSVRLLDIQ